VIGVFREACSDMGDLALKASTDPNQAFAALTVNNYGQFDELIRGRRRRWRKWRSDKRKDGVS
jgi:hypothetical protein